jgi:D-arabinose 1-dehydrogenase-like Zn-dependent alcohol dehydrogenase
VWYEIDDAVRACQQTVCPPSPTGRVTKIGPAVRRHAVGDMVGVGCMIDGAALCVVGALEPPAPVNNMQVAFKRRTVTGSPIGNLAETREVLDFCAEHGIGPEIEMIRIQDVNDAYKKVEKGDVRFRYVIDMASLEEEMAKDA